MKRLYTFKFSSSQKIAVLLQNKVNKSIHQFALDLRTEISLENNVMVPVYMQFVSKA